MSEEHNMGQKIRFDRKPVSGFHIGHDLDEQKLTSFLSKSSMDLNTVNEEALYEFGCGELLGNRFTLNNAGVLFFAREPQRFIDYAYLTCVRYKGTGMAYVLDRKDYHADLLTMVDEAETFVRRHTRLAYRFEGFQRIDLEEYPYKAVREAVINALAHRDYEIVNNAFLNVFDDRIEVISPGDIPDGLTLKEVYGHSHPRNHTLLELFHHVGYIEKIGSGLQRMEELMLAHGLKKPVYETTPAHFIATFYGPGDKLDEMVVAKKGIDLRELGLNERHVKILELLQEKGALSRPEIQKAFGVAFKTTLRDLEILIEKGFIRKEGKTKGSTYRLQ